MLEIEKAGDEKHSTELGTELANPSTQSKFSIESPFLSSSASQHAESALAWRRQRLSLLTSTSPTALARIATQSGRISRLRSISPPLAH